MGVASDYYDDLKLDNAILKAQSDSYRRIRNTFRYLIGNLEGFDEKEKINIEEFPELEKYILHRLWEVDQIIQKCVKDFNFHLMFTTLLNFCSNDLSAFYFDIRKDSIYCDSFDSKKRRSARTLLNLIFDHLVRWLAPSLSFTCEEAWKAKGNTSSIHLEDFLKASQNFKNNDIANKWNIIKNIRKVITGAIEKKRAEKLIGSSLEANVIIYVKEDLKKKIEEINFDEIAITSSFQLLDYKNKKDYFALEEIDDVAVAVEKTDGQKCERCWKYTDILQDKQICQRCDEAIKNRKCFLKYFL